MIRRHPGTVIALAITAMLLVIDPLLAHAAVRANVAGALLSPAGLDNPSAWLLALGFLGARITGAAMLCISVGLVAAHLAAWGLRRFERDR